MLRRREISSSMSSHGSLPETSFSSLPIRNNSVGTSAPSFHGYFRGPKSFFSQSTSPSPIRFTSKKSKPTVPSWIFCVPALLLIVIPWLFPHNLRDDITRYQNNIRMLQQKQKAIVKQIETMTTSVRTYNTKIHSLTKENGKRFQVFRENGSAQTTLSLEMKQYEEIEKAEEGLLRRLDSLERQIQKTCANLATQKYGPEIRRVKVNIADMRGKTSYFIIELASIAEMPHAVHYFLEMVDQNLWDGLSIMFNDGHSSEHQSKHWMASPLVMDLVRGHHAWENQRFQNANLTHLAFTEHSTTYPRPGNFMYTVAFAGHPGGPSFYIRMDDAEEQVFDIHLQTSTFGTIVEGAEVLERHMPLASKSSQNKKEASSSKHMEVLTIRSIELIAEESMGSRVV